MNVITSGNNKRTGHCSPCQRIMSILLAFAAVVLLSPDRTVSAADPAKHHYNISGILNGLQVGYDKRVRPNYGGIPVQIEVSMGVITISSLSEVTMDFTLDIYFRQYWKDERLSFQRQRGVEILSVSTEYLRNMWVPDTFFANEKTAYLHMVTTSNEFVRIRHDGEITRSMRITITASCPMNLKYFPLDSQLCPVEIESFGFTTSEIWYKWVDSPKAVSIFPEVELPQFQVMGYRKRAYIYSLTTGNYSRLACDIQFVRSMGYYLIQIYIPSSLIVVISWVSFWLNRNASPARVSLGVTTVLTMTTLMSSTNAQLPKISYVKSIDIYLGTCFVMVFASLLEYAAVGYIAKRIEMRKKRYQNLQKLAEQRRAALASTNSGPDNETASTVAKSHCTNKSGSTVVQVTAVADTDDLALVSQGKNLNVMYGASPSTIDKYSRVIFPVCFACFHLMYWVIYLHISEVTTEDLTLHNPNG